MSVSLSPDVEAIISTHLSRGDFTSASEMVEAAIRLLDRRKREKLRQIEQLRSMLQEAVDQVERGEWLDGDEVFDEVLRELEETGTVSS